MKTTIVYGPQESGKTVIANSISHYLRRVSQVNPESTPARIQVLELGWPDGHELTAKEFQFEIHRARIAACEYLVLVTCARPSDKALALADYVVETRKK